MPYIMNALETPINTQAHGKWFQWKPGQIKEIQNNDLAMFFTQNRGEEGLVGISDTIMELDKESSEYKEYVEERRKEGVQKRINKLDSIIRNLTESLRFDLQSKGMKIDPIVFASKGELAALKERATLQQYEQSKQLNVAEEVRKQLEIINGGSSSSIVGENNSGRSDSSEPTKAGK